MKDQNLERALFILGSLAESLRQLTSELRQEEGPPAPKVPVLPGEALPTLPDQSWFTVTDAVKLTGFSEGALRRRIRTGKLQALLPSEAFPFLRLDCETVRRLRDEYQSAPPVKRRSRGERARWAYQMGARHNRRGLEKKAEEEPC